MVENYKRCPVCEADFYPKDVDKETGKCKQCTELYPDCKDKLEAMAKFGGVEKNKMGDELDEGRVKEIVSEALNPLMAKLDALLGAKTEVKEEKRVESETPQQFDKVKRGPGRPRKEETKDA